MNNLTKTSQVYDFFWIKNDFCLVYKCHACQNRKICQRINYPENKWIWIAQNSKGGNHD